MNEKWGFFIMKNKAIIILSIILLILMTTTVSASETNTTDTIAINDSNRDDAVNIQTTDNENVNTAIDRGEVSVEDTTNEATVDTNTSKLNDSIIESEELSNNEDVIQSRNVLGTTNPEILTSSNNDTIILAMAPETILTANGDYSEINVRVSRGNNHIIINFKLTGHDMSSFYYTWQVVELESDYAADIWIYDNYYFYSMQLYSGIISQGVSGFISLDYDRFVVDGSILWVDLGSITTQGFYLPRILPEVATTVSVTNPSVNYNSGSFSVSGTETGKIIC